MNQQITFPNGGPSTLEHRRRGPFGHTKWNKDEALREFRGLLQEGHYDGLWAVIRAFNRLRCWPQALELLATEPSPSRELGDALQSFWITHCGLGDDSIGIGRSLKGNLFLFVDALKHHCLPYEGPAISLYRGELRARHERGVYGIAWTSSLQQAENFAERRRIVYEGEGIVLKINALPEMIVVGPNDHSSRIEEHEYLVDPRLIRGVSIAGS